MKLTNGSKYKIFNIEHTIRNNLIIKQPIPMTDLYKLESLYKVIKYTTEFLEYNEINYCIESGTLIGCVRHEGIIPWDNDVDIMIFKDGYFKLQNLIDKFNDNPNNIFSILNMTPGYKLFYNNDCYGELFVYDLDEKTGLYRMAYPFIKQNSFYKPTFITSDIYYNYQRYKEESLFPTRKTIFEDFYVRTPNDIVDVLNNTYKGNLLKCIYNVNLNNQHEKIKLRGHKNAAFIEKLVCNKILLFIYIFFHWLIKRFIVII
jgi:phosphorylcholine metabolism protein LicD